MKNKKISYKKSKMESKELTTNNSNIDDIINLLQELEGYIHYLHTTILSELVDTIRKSL